MKMTVMQSISTIAICVAATMGTRFLPFLIFREGKPTPAFILYLGKALPPAIFAMLVVYCFKNVSFVSGNHGLPELIALGVTVFLHLWKKNMMLSMAGGTVIYMLLVQMVFA